LLLLDNQTASLPKFVLAQNSYEINSYLT